MSLHFTIATTLTFLLYIVAPATSLTSSTPYQDFCIYLDSSSNYGSYSPAQTTPFDLGPSRRGRPTYRPPRSANASAVMDDSQQVPPTPPPPPPSASTTEDAEFDELLDRPVVRNIIGGTALPMKAWPFLVALLVTGDTLRYNNRYWDLVCGGTLIAPQYILTAAHCFVDENEYSWRFLDAGNFVARIGDYDLVKNQVPTAVTMRISSYRTYPGFSYDSVEAGYDIAIAKLEQPVNFNDWTQPACLPAAGSPVPRWNAPCLVAGWGSINKEGTRLSAYPRITTLPASASSTCYNTLEIPSSAHDGRMFCAGDPTGARDSCAGDSGGPTFCKKDNGAWELSGVVSFGGENCADAAVPGAYTTISYYLSWIHSTLQSMGNAGGSRSAAPPSPQFLYNSNNYYQQPAQFPPFAPATTRRNPWQPYLPARSSAPMIQAPGSNVFPTTTPKTDEQLLALLRQLVASMGGNYGQQRGGSTTPEWDLP